MKSRPFASNPEVAIRSPSWKLAAATGLCLAGTACASVPASGQRRVVLPSYLFGTLEQRAFDVRDLCSGRTTELEFTSTPSTVALSIVTLGIYTPRELRLRCETEPAPRAPGH
jgi:hypothetical protein